MKRVICISRLVLLSLIFEVIDKALTLLSTATFYALKIQKEGLLFLLKLLELLHHQICVLIYIKFTKFSILQFIELLFTGSKATHHQLHDLLILCLNLPLIHMSTKESATDMLRGIRRLRLRYTG